MEDYSAYRAQITAIDLCHLALIVVVVLIILSLSLATHATGDGWYAIWVPLFCIAMLGLIIRLDTMVHRLGGFLLSRGDPWEIAKASHLPSKILMPIADVLVMVPVLVLTIYCRQEALVYLNGTIWQVVYAFLSSCLLSIGVFGWVFAATKASHGFGKN